MTQKERKQFYLDESARLIRMAAAAKADADAIVMEPTPSEKLVKSWSDCRWDVSDDQMASDIDKTISEELTAKLDSILEDFKKERTRYDLAPGTSQPSAIAAMNFFHNIVEKAKP